MSFGDLRRGLEQVADVLGGEVGVTHRALRDRIDDLAQRVDGIEGRVSDLESQISELNSELN